MIGLDTNVLIRILVEDDPDQCARAAAFMKNALTQREPLFISHIVICESVWVLSSCYGFAREEIAEVLGSLLQALGVVVEESRLVARALERYRQGKGDLSDHLIMEHALSAGCERVATFDKALLSHPGFFAP